MKVFIFSVKTRNALCLSMLDHDMALEIKDGDFTVIKGQDIRSNIV